LCGKEREKRKKNHVGEKQKILTRHPSPPNSSSCSRIIITIMKKIVIQIEKKKIMPHT
jgi:hypothetical protein